MRKKLLALITALCMMLAGAVPTFATETVSSDPDVQGAYDAYIAMEEAMYTTGDYAAMVAAFNTLDQKSTIIDDDDAKSEEWQKIVADKVGTDKFLNDAFNLAFAMVVFEKEIEGEKGLIEDYKTAPDIKKAYDLVDTYELLEEDNVLMDKMAESIDTVDPSRQVVDTYKAAETAIAAVSPDVIAVYEAYILVDDAVTYADPDDFDEAISEFEKVLDTFNEGLDDNEKADLAVLIGAKDWEEAFSMILGDWINLNIADEMVGLYDAYKADPNKETAKAFVEKYDSIYNDPSYVDEELQDLVSLCIEDIDAAYNEAKALLNGTGGSGSGEADPDPDNEGNGNSPDTGDNFNVLPFAAAVILAALGMGAAVVRRRA